MIFQRLDRRQFQLKDMALTWIHVDRMNRFASCRQGVVQDVTTSAGDCENAVVCIDAKAFHIDIGVFPNLTLS